MQTLLIVVGHQSTSDGAHPEDAERFRNYNVNLTKPERMREWARLPLDMHEQRLQWLHDKARMADVRLNANVASPFSTSHVRPSEAQESVLHDHSMYGQQQGSFFSMRPIDTGQGIINAESQPDDSSTLRTLGTTDQSPSFQSEGGEVLPKHHISTNLPPSPRLPGSSWSNLMSLSDTSWQQPVSSHQNEESENLMDVEVPFDEHGIPSKAQSLSSRYSKRFF